MPTTLRRRRAKRRAPPGCSSRVTPLHVRMKARFRRRLDREGVARGEAALCDRAQAFFETHREVRGVGVHCLSTAKDYARDARAFLSLERRPGFDADAWWKRYRGDGDVDGALLRRTPGRAVAIVSLFVRRRCRRSSLSGRSSPSSRSGRSAPPSCSSRPRSWRANRSSGSDGSRKQRAEIEIAAIGWPVARVELCTPPRAGTRSCASSTIALLGFAVIWIKLRSLHPGGGRARRGAAGARRDPWRPLPCSTGSTRALGAGVARESSPSWFTSPAWCLGFRSRCGFEAFNTAEGSDGRERWAVAPPRRVKGPFAIVARHRGDGFPAAAGGGERRCRPVTVFQIGVLASVGIVIAWFMARHGIPVLYRLAGREHRGRTVDGARTGCSRPG